MNDAIVEPSASVTIEEEDDGMEEVVNISGEPAKFKIDSSTVTLQPGGKVRIARAYAIGHKIAGRDARASAISLMTGNRVVAVSDPRAKTSPYVKRVLPEAKVVS